MQYSHLEYIFEKDVVNVEFRKEINSIDYQFDSSIDARWFQTQTGHYKALQNIKMQLQVLSYKLIKPSVDLFVQQLWHYRVSVWLHF